MIAENFDKSRNQKVLENTLVFFYFECEKHVSFPVLPVWKTGKYAVEEPCNSSKVDHSSEAIGILLNLQEFSLESSEILLNSLEFSSIHTKFTFTEIPECRYNDTPRISINCQCVLRDYLENLFRVIAERSSSQC